MAEPSLKSSKAIWVQLNKNRYGCSYHMDGKLCSNNGEFFETPFDIIHLEQPAFDWATVKPGMAFFISTDLQKGEIYFYVGPSLKHKDWVILLGDYSLHSKYERKNLIRAPEHDIEVPS